MYMGASKKFRIDFGTHPLTIPVNSQIKSDLYLLWDVEYAMFSAGIKYFNTCSEYWLYKLESEYIKAEKEYMAKQTDI